MGGVVEEAIGLSNSDRRRLYTVGDVDTCNIRKHPVPDRVKSSFVIFDIRAL